MTLSHCLGGTSPSVGRFDYSKAFIIWVTPLTTKVLSYSSTHFHFLSISANFSWSPWIFYPSFPLKGLQLFRVKCNPLRYGFMSWYVLAVYASKPLIDSILAMSNPPSSLSSVSTKSCINILTLSRQYCEAIPHTPSVVWVSIPAQGTGSWDVPCTFLNASLIPSHKHVDPHLLQDSQLTSSLGPIGIPYST